MADRHAEFYIGYQPKAPARLARFLRIIVGGLVLLGLAVGLFLARSQDTFDHGVFEFGVDREFTGVVVERPYPLLLTEENGALTPHLLTAFGKFGADERVKGLDGTPVRLTGSRIHNRKQRMIEVHDLAQLEGEEASRLRTLVDSAERSLGRMTLVGEIVDSKCHLGVMNPGRGKTHRACAVRCISGGVPPVLRIEDESGETSYLLLVGADGRSVTDEVLDLVAEPLEIDGEVVRSHGLLVLYADPDTYRRL